MSEWKGGGGGGVCVCVESRNKRNTHTHSQNTSKLCEAPDILSNMTEMRTCVRKEKQTKHIQNLKICTDTHIDTHIRKDIHAYRRQRIETQAEVDRDISGFKEEFVKDESFKGELPQGAW